MQTPEQYTRETELTEQILRDNGGHYQKMTRSSVKDMFVDMDDFYGRSAVAHVVSRTVNTCHRLAEIAVREGAASDVDATFDILVHAYLSGQFRPHGDDELDQVIAILNQ